MTQLSTLCGIPQINNQTLFFSVYDSQFDDCSSYSLEYQNIQTFILRSGDSGNNQPSNNKMNYVITKILPHHMNLISVEAWYAFKVSYVTIIRETFVKTSLLPFIYPDFATNAQECVYFVQVSSGVKAEDINTIENRTIVRIKIQ